MAEFYRSGLLERYTGCIHAVTTKDATVAYEGSLALHTGESPADITANRGEIEKALGVDDAYVFISAHQTHSDNIVTIKDQKSQGWHTMQDAIADCDAIVTDQKGVILTVLTADCVPVLLYDAKREVVAAVHAGWKGTKANITGKTVAKMREVFGTDPADIVAFIAPSIGRCCYEVGEDVAGHFMEHEACYDQVGSKYMLDLPHINQQQLLDAGLKEEYIELSGECTSCEVDRFFSYRKEQGCSGRFMSMIGLRV